MGVSMLAVSPRSEQDTSSKVGINPPGVDPRRGPLDLYPAAVSWRSSSAQARRMLCHAARSHSSHLIGPTWTRT